MFVLVIGESGEAPDPERNKPASLGNGRGQGRARTRVAHDGSGTDARTALR